MNIIPTNMNITKVMVACTNSNGEPDFFFCKIRCTPEQYNNGQHYVCAEQAAIDEGYEPRMAFDENDTAGRAIVKHFRWSVVNEYSI
jgi:hypothetical protein